MSMQIPMNKLKIQFYWKIQIVREIEQIRK